jgi:hypothetical protein
MDALRVQLDFEALIVVGKSLLAAEYVSRVTIVALAQRLDREGTIRGQPELTIRRFDYGRRIGNQ